MSTEKNVWNEQIMRCSALQKFPLYPEGIRELRDTLKKAAQSPSRAERVMDRVLNEREYCPTPKELQQIAADILREEDETPAGCQDCGGTPWVTTQITVIDYYTREPMVREGARRCFCSRGNWFRSKDAERKAASA